MDFERGELEGQVAELQVAADLMDDGYLASVPFGEYRYDLVVDNDATLVRVQVKKANQHSDNHYKLLIRDYDESEVDIFGGYIAEEDETFYVASSEVGKNNFRINTKSRNEIDPNNRSQAKLLEDFTFERALSDWRDAKD